MKAKRWWAGCIGVMALVLIGCAGNPIYNVANAPVTTTTRGYAVRDVRGAILQAGTSLGWQMRENRPGLIIGTLRLRDHMAQVEIPYNRRNYSIIYRDSDNLNYDGANIHRNYNSWVQRLDKAINARLSLL